MGANGWDEELPYHLKGELKDSSKSLENLTVSEGRDAGLRGYFSYG